MLPVAQQRPSTVRHSNLLLNRWESPNRTLGARWDKKIQELHRSKVRTAKPAVKDNWKGLRPHDPRPQYGHMIYNGKKAMLQEERFATIEYENSLLLGKMRRIMQVGTAASNPGVYVADEVPPRSLNEGWRRRELRRITEDNLGIVRRIQDCPPSYDQAAWERQERKRREHKERISRFPPGS